MNGRVGRAVRNCAATDGSRPSSRSHAPAVAISIEAATASVNAAPALVIPLLNRNTQIHPPGNT